MIQTMHKSSPRGKWLPKAKESCYPVFIQKQDSTKIYSFHTNLFKNTLHVIGQVVAITNPWPPAPVNKEGAYKAGEELVAKIKGLSGAALSDYMNMNFGELWDHFDVNKSGLVEIERMSQFYKMLLKDMKQI